MKKFCVSLLKKSRALSSIAVRIRGVHPKHLVEIREFWIKKYLKKTDTVLDLGCGNGERDFKIVPYCKSVIGVDYDKKNIEIAKKNCEKRGLKNIEFIQKDIFNYFAGVACGQLQQLFDKIVLLDVLEHINNRQQLLKNIYNRLKEDGQFFISVPNKNSSWKKMQQNAGVNYFTDPDHKIEYSKEEIIKELDSAGFNIIVMETDVADTPWAPFFDLIGAFSLSLYKKCLEWKRKEVLKHPDEASGWEIVCQKQ